MSACNRSTTPTPCRGPYSRPEPMSVAHFPLCFFLVAELALVVSGWLLLFATPARAERLPVTTYGLPDGLPSTFIHHIMSDSRGLLWFATRDGLARFDGARFVTYGMDHGLPVPTVTYLLETRDGHYWVGTTGAGLCRMDSSAARVAVPADDRRRLFHCVSLGSASADRINMLDEDAAGRILVGTEVGLFMAMPSTALTVRFIDLSVSGAPPDRNNIRTLLSGDNGDIWVGGPQGLIRVLGDGRIMSYPEPRAWPTPDVWDIIRGDAGAVWILYSRGLRKLRVPSTHDASSGAADQDVWTGITDVRRRALARSSDGHVWIGTDHGLINFDGRQQRVYGLGHGLPAGDVLRIAEDRDANLWIAALSGLFKLNREGFITYDRADGLPRMPINTLLEDPDGHVVAAGGRWVLGRFNGAGFTSATPALSEQWVPAWAAQLALVDRHGGWWMLGSAAGLAWFAGVGEVEQLDRRAPTALYMLRDGLPGEIPYRLLEDHRGDVWIGSRGNPSGLGRWQRATGRFEIFPDAQGNVPGDGPSALTEVAPGTLWVGFYQGGLARHRGGRFERIDGDNVPRGMITAIYHDDHRRLWIGSNTDGLIRVDDPSADRPTFVRYTTAEGLASNNVRCVISDDAGRIFAGSVRGVDRLDPLTGSVRHYTTADGLANDFVMSALRDRRGDLWFGTQDGLSRLVRGTSRPTTSPPIWIEAVRVRDVALPVSHLGQQIVRGLSLAPDQNHVEIDFYTVEFRAGGPAKYQYRLEGADDTWSRPTEDRTVRYSRLSPGPYQFAVRAVNADGVTSDAPARVEFIILPPFWQRWWFRASTAVAIAGLVFAAHRRRIARLLAAERVRMRIAADLHDDLGGTLSRIALQSEIARREAAGPAGKTSARLADIADTARAAVEAMDDVVWSVDPRRDDVGSLLSRIREHASEVLEASGIELLVDSPARLDHITLDPAARRHLFLLLKEAVSNAARHSGAATLSLHVQVVDRLLRIELQDDGRGFDPVGLGAAQGHGLDNMRERGRQLGGELTIDTSPAGTRLALAIPIRRGIRMNMRFPIIRK